MEKMGDEFGATVRGNMAWDTMLGKDMENEKLCQLQGCDSIVSWDEQ